MSYRAYFYRRLLLQQQDVADVSATIADSSPTLSLDDDDKAFLWEDVDDSEAGWSTDFGITVLGLCYMWTAWRKYDVSQQHFLYMHLGTAVAHLAGGLAHAVFLNRASDGHGMVGFYIAMMIGYCGNCLRWGVGWGLGGAWAIAADLNALLLIVMGFVAIGTMTVVTERVDNAHPDVHVATPADTYFGYAELACAVGEIVASVVYGVKMVRSTTIPSDTKLYVILAVTSNLVGWISVYSLGFYSVHKSDFEYDSRVTQLIFHYAMLVFLWAVNEIAVTDSSTDDKQNHDGAASADGEQRRPMTYGSTI